MFLDEDLANRIYEEYELPQVYTEPDEFQNFLPDFELYIWHEQIAIRIYPNDEFEIGMWDAEDEEFYF